MQLAVLQLLDNGVDSLFGAGGDNLLVQLLDFNGAVNIALAPVGGDFLTVDQALGSVGVVGEIMETL